MKSFFLVLLLISIPTASWGQGSAILLVEKTSREPIDEAIIRYRYKSEKVILTDKYGKFKLPALSDNEVISIQKMGYKSITLLYSMLKWKPIVELEIEPIVLAPVEISYIAANKLLEKAFYNTKSRLITKKPIYYQGHLLQVDKQSEEAQEIYFQYSSMLKSIPRRRVSPELNLLALTHTQSLPGIPSSAILRDKKLRVEYDFDYNAQEISSNFFIHYSSSPNDSLFVLDCTRKVQTDYETQYTFYINKADTTLNSINMVNTRIGNKEFKRGLKKNKEIMQIEFRKIDAGYYIYRNLDFFDVDLYYKKKIEHISDYSEIIKIDNPMNADILAGKKIKLNSKELFNIPNTTEVKFW